MIALAVVAASLAADPVSAVRGLAASVPVRYAATLRARSEQSPTTPILVRVQRRGADEQVLEFIGSVAGTFDLRAFVEREDGLPMDGLPPLPVTVVSTLPAGHGTDLFDSGEGWFDWRAHYRELAWAAGAAWLCVPAAALAWRAARRPRAATAAPVVPPRTVGQLLAEALESARGGALTVAERGRLELLVFRYFAERLGRPELEGGDPAVVYGAVREHAEARGLVRALEGWLHARGGEETAHHAAAALEELRRRVPAEPARQGVPA